MLAAWNQDLQSLEAISQDDETRRLFLRLAALWHEGRLEPFLVELAHDPQLDDLTKRTLSEIAQDEAFLLAVADYMRRTLVLH